MANKVLVTGLLAFATALIFLVQHSAALGKKKWQIVDSKLEVVKGDLVTMSPDTKFVLTEDLHIMLEGDMQFQPMEELVVYYHVEKKSMNFVKDGEIDVCDAMRENSGNEKAAKAGDCMFNLFGLGSSCPIQQQERDKSKSCDISDAKDKMEMAKGNTTFEYELNAGDDDTATIVRGYFDIQSV